jgi:hypothetical protein
MEEGFDTCPIQDEKYRTALQLVWEDRYNCIAGALSMNLPILGLPVTPLKQLRLEQVRACPSRITP